MLTFALGFLAGAASLLVLLVLGLFAIFHIAESTSSVDMDK